MDWNKWIKPLNDLKEIDAKIDIVVEGLDIIGIRIRDDKIEKTKSAHTEDPYARIFCADPFQKEIIVKTLLDTDSIVITEAEEADLAVSEAPASIIPDGPLAKEPREETIRKLHTLAKEMFSFLKISTTTFKREGLPLSAYLEKRTEERAVLTKDGLKRAFQRSIFRGIFQVGEREYEFTFPAGSFKDLSSGKKMDEHYLIQMNDFRKTKEILRDIDIHSLPEGKIPSVISGAVLTGYVMDQILITGWKTLTAKAYCQKATPFFDQLGQKTASENVTICDFPEIPFSLGECGFARKIDSEGTLSQPVTLIDHGVLTGLLTTVQSAWMLSLENNGHAGRTPSLVRGTLPTETPTNLVLMPGTASFEDLLLEQEDQVLVYDLFDQFHGLDTASGDFEYPCRLAVLKNGIPVSKITQAVVKGNLKSLFRSIKKSGKDLTILPLVIMETYTVSSPDVLAGGLEFR